MAAMVFSKVGGSGSGGIRSMSWSSCAIPASMAVLMSWTLNLPNGGTPPFGPCQGASSTFWESFMAGVLSSALAGLGCSVAQAQRATASAVNRRVISMSSRFHELDGESILVVCLGHAGVGVRVARVLRWAQEGILAGDWEAGLRHLVPHHLLVDPVQAFSIGDAASRLRAVVDDGVDAARFQHSEHRLVHLVGVALLRDGVVVDRDRIDRVKIFHLGRKRVVPLPDEGDGVLHRWLPERRRPAPFQP